MDGSTEDFLMIDNLVHNEVLSQYELDSHDGVLRLLKTFESDALCVYRSCAGRDLGVWR